MCRILDHLNTVAPRVRGAHVREKAVWQTMAVRFVALAHGAFLRGTNQTRVVVEARKWLRAYNQLDITAVV